MAAWTNAFVRRLCMMALTLAIAFGASDSHADATSEAYDDVKEIITELITQDFADSTTAWLACNSGNLPNYYIRSLQRLRDRQWGALRATLHDDTVTLITDFVYEASLGALTNQPLSFESWIETTGGHPDWKFDVGGTKGKEMAQVCQAIFPATGTPSAADRAALLTYVRDTNPNKQTILADNCAMKENEDQRTACSLALAFGSAMQGKDVDAEGMLETIVKVVKLSPEVCGKPVDGSKKADPVATACEKMAPLFELLAKKESDFRDMIVAASKHDLRTLSVLALSLAIPKPEDDVTPDTCTLETLPYRRLTIGFVTYILDEEAQADGREVSRQAFRAVALEVVRCLSDAGLDASPSAIGILPTSFLCKSTFTDARQIFFAALRADSIDH